MNLIPVRTPKLIKGIFPNYIWNMPQDQKKIYLTFDDGPTPDITLWTLKLLKEYHAKATFFCIGNNIEKHPEIFDAIIRDGHTVGNHTYAHPKGWTTNKDTYVDQVIQTQGLIDYRIENFNIQSPNPKSERQKLFRPPYGQITGQQGKQLLALDYTIIMWDILAFDWKDSISEEQCAKNVISKTRPGSIIVFHDSVKAAKNMIFALPKVLHHFNKAGFKFERL
ncbi:polysaccharide deacetylase family protein [Gelidibacter maritimus]|uniref:Polysaccharide deacetylase family protein n=1 Tax=Gelidibacter maritimus TaxID=2761487 RepID=A0A7W2M3W9_9FLAO|nr:polysaccharide deacetylase family protein [Gelidibacter maritimus]MBA6152220.1 polysaccharide deacetylase family protein [Gelidibacter maritimus]